MLIYIYAYVCMYVCMYVCIHVMYTCMHSCMYVYIYTMTRSLFEIFKLSVGAVRLTELNAYGFSADTYMLIVNYIINRLQRA